MVFLKKELVSHVLGAWDQSLTGKWVLHRHMRDFSLKKIEQRLPMSKRGCRKNEGVEENDQ